MSATISPPYDSPDRYADAFRVLAPDGTVLGVRELLHDHANEQPFTRSLDDVEIPDDVDRVTVEGRDLGRGHRHSGRSPVRLALIGAGHAHLHMLRHAATLAQHGIEVTLVARPRSATAAWPRPRRRASSRPTPAATPPCGSWCGGV